LLHEESGVAGDFILVSGFVRVAVRCGNSTEDISIDTCEDGVMDGREAHEPWH
jgi:hypothetical protein